MRRTTIKKTISLQPDVWEYVSHHAAENVSAFINKVLRNHRHHQFQKAMIEGYKAMAGDEQLAEEIRLWDTTLMDGLVDEDR